MSIGNLLKYGAMGLAADLFAPMLTRGAATPLASLYGLFTPDARDMDRAYAPDRFGLPPAREWNGGQVAALLFGAATILPAISNVFSPYGMFGDPFYVPSIWATPWSPADLLPVAWNRGLIPNWGWTAGWLT